MRSRAWFVYFLKRSIRERAGRFALSVSAVFLAVSIVSALITLTAGVRGKLGSDLRAYGANMIVTDSSGGVIDWEVSRKVAGFSAAVQGASPRVFGTVALEGRWVEVIGMETTDMAGYRVTGRTPSAEGEAMIGADLAAVLHAGPGRELVFADGKRVTARGVFERGPDEDAAVVLPLRDAAELLGAKGVSAILLNADVRSHGSLETGIRAAFPSLRARSVRQVAVAEERFLTKVQLLMTAVTAVVLFSAVIALGSAMGANVIERTGEIGVLKALGAAPLDIARFFVSEAALSGLAGGLGGWLAGIALAELISWTAFGSLIPVTPLGLPVALAVGVPLAVLSTILPVREAMRLAPAEILRGE